MSIFDEIEEDEIDEETDEFNKACINCNYCDIISRFGDMEREYICMITDEYIRNPYSECCTNWEEKSTCYCDIDLCPKSPKALYEWMTYGKELKEEE